jgi:hypothetical protein
MKLILIFLMAVFTSGALYSQEWKPMTLGILPYAKHLNKASDHRDKITTFSSSSGLFFASLVAEELLGTTDVRFKIGGNLKKKIAFAVVFRF